MGSPSSVIKVSSVKPFNYLKMKPVPGLRLVSKLEFLSARLLLFLEKLRRAKPFWMELIVLSANCKGTLQIHVLQSTICKQSMDAIRPPSASLSPPFTQCKLKLMVCFLPPKMLRRNPKRQWLMLLVLLMNFAQSRTMPLLWLLPRTLWETSLESLKVSLLPHSLALEKQPRLSRGVTARLRNLHLPREWFQIAIDNTKLVKMTNGECDLGEVKLGHWLEKVALSLHEHEQLATGLKCVAQLDNVGMADGFQNIALGLGVIRI